ncbi:MAG: ribonuclease M5 [Erysipelotrichales bacterium]|nr:ribonuclease M5 [Erysipelotrichales bacterium]
MKEYDAIFVVEGKNDVQRLSKLIKADFFITGGLNVPEELLTTLKELSKKKEIVVFTDPDSPGNRIRHKITEAVPSARQVFLSKEDALGKKKVGVEHANDEAILRAIEHMTPAKRSENTLSMSEYRKYGLSGEKNSRQRRLKLSKVFHIGYADAKTFYKWLNLAGITAEDLERECAHEDEKRNG